MPRIESHKQIGFTPVVKSPLRVARAPSKPVMLYDGDCRFCSLWIRRWNQITGEEVEYLRAQDERVGQRYPEIPVAALDTAVHLIDTEGLVYRGADAVFQALATNPAWGWPLKLYRRSAGVARSSEAVYRFVAEHRSLFSFLTRVFWGQHVERPDYFLVRRGFLALLGGIYFIAFISLWMQVSGLIGNNGILPAVDLMAQARNAVVAENIGINRFHLLPTLCWFGGSDGFLKLQCAAGGALAVLLVVGIAPSLCLALMWLLYLSLTTVGGDFLAFQWDNLLLETGFLAIFLGPVQWLPRPACERRPSGSVLWLLRLLLFKLMFLSGLVKLTSGDPTWRNLTALTYHYETQPLPTPLAWYAHQLPTWFQRSSCAAMFVIELVVPFCVFLPRGGRMFGAAALGFLQVCILLTGNYTFFNWLTLALCFLLLDDFPLKRLVPKAVADLYQRSGTVAVRGRWQRVWLAPVVLVFIAISTIQVTSPLHQWGSWASPVMDLYGWLSPFRTINSYGLFMVMTTERPEIVIEGSLDGREWKGYEFKYKPGNLRRAPRFVAPYQPRLDWQMWFAALGSVRQNPWFINFCFRLLHGSPEVLDLLAQNPFPTGPPKYIRAQLYDYRFTTYPERAQTGAWWKRTFKGEYLPPVSLEMLHPPPPP